MAAESLQCIVFDLLLSIWKTKEKHELKNRTENYESGNIMGYKNNNDQDDVKAIIESTITSTITYAHHIKNDTIMSTVT